jgi:hypothetical protein
MTPVSTAELPLPPADAQLQIDFPATDEIPDPVNEAGDEPADQPESD